VVGVISRRKLDCLGRAADKAVGFGGSATLPPPWTADTIPDGHFVRDANGPALTRSLRRQR
jgi:hypothetical protein